MNRTAQRLRVLGAAVIGLFIILALHTRGHLIEPFFLRYLVIWIPGYKPPRRQSFARLMPGLVFS